MNVREVITNAIEVVTGENIIYLETPENSGFGDYSTNIAMVLFAKNKEQGTRNKETKKQKNGSRFTNYGSPSELAEEIVGKLKEDKELLKIVEKIEIAGPGFINFYLRKEIYYDTLNYITKQYDTYGKSDIGKSKTVVIDYSAPNIAKPFGIGHLRSTIIGQALYNIYEAQGYKVIGDNHLGDWGTQFGKLLYKLQDLDADSVKKLTIKDLEELYVSFHKEADEKPELEEKAREWFKKLEDGDEKARKLWKLCVDVSLKEFDRIYDILDIKIDVSYGESYYEHEIKKLLDDPKIKKYLVNGEGGAKIVDLTGEGIDTPLMFLKSDGATTYATRDLACINFRVSKWDPDIFIYEVGSQQKLYFQQVFAAARILGLVRKDVELYHTNHGWYLGPDGKKFSTREGKTVKLEEVLTEAIERAKKLGSADEDTAKKVGIGAIKYYDLMRSVQTDVVFDWKNILDMEGNSGPYLQYTAARTNSVLRKAEFPISNFQFPNKKQLANYNLNQEELAILRTLIHFPEIVTEAAEKYAPNLICNYLYDLAQKYNSFYARHKIITDFEHIGSEAGDDNAHKILEQGKGNKEQGIVSKEQSKFRLELTKATGIVLKNGLKLLGIKAPERM